MARRGNPFAKDPFGQRRAVMDSSELGRILAMPRRRWEDRYPEVTLDPQVRSWVYSAIAHKWTDDQIFQHVPQARPFMHVLRLEAWLRQPHGQQSLRPIQIAALFEAFYAKGLLMPAAVGAGKSLVSLLAFVVLQSKRPLLLLPAKLIEKTEREEQHYRKNWIVPGYVRKVSYEKLGRAHHANLLVEMEPDVIVADEAHRLRNSSAAVTRRVKRYLADRPHVIFVGMSGTIMKRSILDFAHLLDWALRAREDVNPPNEPRTPLPQSFEDRMTWSMALDQKRDNEGRLAPGALVQFCTEAEQRELAAVEYEEGLGIVRRAVMRRVMESEGVVATSSRMIGASLRVENVILPVAAADFHRATTRLRERWERPDEEPLLDAIDVWRHMREVACGFFYRWNPAPPAIWREQRRLWAAFVRAILKSNRQGIDSELQVVQAISRGLYERNLYDEWKRVQPLYDPEKNKEAVWIDQTVLDFAARWMRKEASEVPREDQGGIVWIEHTEFGQELSRRTGIPFYGEAGYEQTGKTYIEAHPAGQPLIASIGSNGEGRNLQAWSRNLIVSVPQNGARFEQLLGRTHREGQEADDVVYYFTTTVPEQLQSFERARADAQAITDMTGQPQKLVYCDVVLHEFGSARTGTQAA
jgi:hypothetical protein